MRPRKRWMGVDRISANWKVNGQIASVYVEARLAPDVSMFTNVPFRFTDPEFNANHAGLSDVSLGLKWAFVLEPTRAISFQVAGTAPTATARRGMGSGNWSVQPGFLWQEVLTDRLTLFSEVEDSIPIHSARTSRATFFNMGRVAVSCWPRLATWRFASCQRWKAWAGPFLACAESPEYQVRQ